MFASRIVHKLKMFTIVNKDGAFEWEIGSLKNWLEFVHYISIHFCNCFKCVYFWQKEKEFCIARYKPNKCGL